MLKKILIFIFCLFPNIVLADDCLGFKLNPDINIKTPTWSKQVVQPLQKMDVLHGDVIATMVDNYELTTDITSIEDGFCVALKRVDATIGYSDFLVQIDLSHKKNSCSYNAVLSHEDEHIRAYLSVIDDNQDLLKKSLKSAAISITPIFVKNQKDIDSAVDKLNEELQSHPDIILLKQHLKAEEEIRNKRIDQNDTGESLRKCFL
jgi:hypothetical protein